MSNCFDSAARVFIASSAPDLIMRAFANFVLVRFCMMAACAAGELSTNTASFAPRESASMPIAPLPAKTSKKRAFGTRDAMMLNRLSFALSDVGLVAVPVGAVSKLRRATPAITRKKIAPFFHVFRL